MSISLPSLIARAPVCVCVHVAISGFYRAYPPITGSPEEIFLHVEVVDIT